MDNRQLLAIVGSLLLVIGVFTPVLSIPMAGNITYFQNGEGDGVFVLLFGLIGLLAAFRKAYRGVAVVALLSAGILVFTFINLRRALSSAKAELAVELAGNPFGGLGEALMQSVQMKWGWGVLLAGIVLMLLSAKSTSPEPMKDREPDELD